MTNPQTAPSATIYVDLDGTLIHGDMLWESLLQVARRRPWLLLAVPFWLFQGRAGFKHRLAAAVSIDPASLPYAPEVIARLKAKRASGCRLILATAAAEPFARGIADYLQLFDGVLSTTPDLNLKGPDKLAVIEAHCKGGPFEYWGDSAADLPIFARASGGLLVHPSPSVRLRLARINPAIPVLERPEAAVPALFRALRIHQWVKNLLVFIPAVTAHRILDVATARAGALGFIVFSLIASSHYLINDLLDLPSDRSHPTKRFRPLASGALPVPAGLILSFLLLAGAVLSMLAAPPEFRYWVLVYFLLTNLYSLVLKRMLLVDVLTLSSLYTVRILAGGAIAGIQISEWLIAFSMFFFTSLAFTKRFTELKSMLDRGVTGMVNGRGYRLADLDLVRVVGPVTGLMAIVVLALYINSSATFRLYRHPGFLWLLCPLLAFWILRVWFIANRGELDQDPVVFALRDRGSYFVGLAAILTMIVAAR